MADTNTQTHTFSQFIGLLGLVGEYVWQLTPIAAFLFVSLLPGEALAATQTFEVPLAVFLPVSPATDEVRPGMVLGVTSTAYSSTVGQTDSSPLITASGEMVGPYGAASNFLPLGSKVRIAGRVYKVNDAMNARFSGGKRRIDVWMASREGAKQFGVREQVIEIVSIPR